MDQKKMRELEDRCVQEQPPACAAACPVHVDVKAFLADMAKGNFEGALKTYRKTVPFPGIIGRICDHPCQDACRLAETGCPISIAALEKTCVRLASATSARQLVPRKKDFRVAVAGGGLSGLTTAHDLALKGYEVVLFEAGESLGGSLLEMSEDVLPRQIIIDDTALLKKLGVGVRLNTAAGKDVSLAELLVEFNAVYLGLGVNFLNSLGLGIDSRGRVSIDPVTFSTGREGIFAGGSMTSAWKGSSPIRSVSDGRRAAISIDRYLQKVSLTASRDREGHFITRLYTGTEGIVPVPAVAASDPGQGFDRHEAVREAGRCLQCQCLECVKACEYLSSYRGYPKRYIREIYNNTTILKGLHLANKMINSCSLCGLCKVVCPSDIDMGEVCKTAREGMVERGKMPPSVHEFALQDMEFSNSESSALTRREPGLAESRFLFFPGCQLSASSPDYVEKVYDFLRQKLAGGVGLMLRCCGAPADWAGRKVLFASACQEILRQWEEMDKPCLVLACSSCYQVFRDHLPEVKTVSLWELYDQFDLPDVPRERCQRNVAVHDACATRDEKGIHNSVRRILEKLDCRVEELVYSKEKAVCCGFGGLMSFANPELGAQVLDRRAGESEADYVAYCAMCRDRLASRGKRTLHLLDLIYGGDRTILPKGGGRGTLCGGRTGQS